VGLLEGTRISTDRHASFLRNRGVDVLFKAAWDGHHWHERRDQLRAGLMWVLNPGGEKPG
jgi:hypothetical protein